MFYGQIAVYPMVALTKRRHILRLCRNCLRAALGADIRTRYNELAFLTHKKDFKLQLFKS
jgi:hypothetical protein